MPVQQPGLRSLCLPFAVGAVALAGLLASPARALEIPAEVDLAWAVAHSDAIALVQVADPPSVSMQIPMRGCRDCPPFDRYRRQFVRVQLLTGQVPRRFAVDEPSWRQRMAAHRDCAERHACRELDLPIYAGQLSREPPPGKVVLAFLRRAGADLELVAERALDSADRVGEVRKAAAARRRGQR